MPELGKYAAEVVSAYAVSLLLLFGLLIFSIRQAAHSKKQLKAVEIETKRHADKKPVRSEAAPDPALSGSVS